MTFGSNNRINSVTNKFHFFVVLSFLLIILVAFSVEARPKTKTVYGYSLEGYPRIQLKNETIKELACSVAVDGFKKKFRLPPYTTSQWFTLKDKRYTYSSFSTWCDYIDRHPEYKQYNRGG